MTAIPTITSHITPLSSTGSDPAPCTPMSIPLPCVKLMRRSTQSERWGRLSTGNIGYMILEQKHSSWWFEPTSETSSPSLLSVRGSRITWHGARDSSFDSFLKPKRKPAAPTCLCLEVCFCQSYKSSIIYFLGHCDYGSAFSLDPFFLVTTPVQ